MDVAVVLPTYQAASTLGLALASIAGQEHPAHEVMVVDDCSTDGTTEVVARWEHLLPLRVIRHSRNLGLAAAVRSGVQAATTPVIARLDADDVWLPDHLQTLTAHYQRAGGLVSANCWSWVPGLALAETSWYEKHRIPRPGQELVALARHNWIVGSVMFHRSDHDRVGGIRDMPASEDWDLWLRMLDAGVPVTTTPNVTMLYRQSLGTMSKGRRSLLASAALLRDFASTGRNDEARRVAARTSREMVRRAALHHSYYLARTGSVLDARSTAARALLGYPRTAVRAAAMFLAPARSVRFYDRLQSEAKRRAAA